MLVRILAGLVHIKRMMGVLQRGDPEPATCQQRQEPGQQGGLAGPAPAGQPEDTDATHSDAAPPPLRGPASVTGTKPFFNRIASPLRDSRYNASRIASGLLDRTAIPYSGCGSSSAGMTRLVSSGSSFSRAAEALQ